MRFFIQFYCQTRVITQEKKLRNDSSLISFVLHFFTQLLPTLLNYEDDRYPNQVILQPDNLVIEME